MSMIIEAIFENGVFRPLEKIDIRVLSRDEWQKRFNRLIEKIQKKAALYTTEEIEVDITKAIKEVRKNRRAG